MTKLEVEYRYHLWEALKANKAINIRGIITNPTDLTYIYTKPRHEYTKHNIIILDNPSSVPTQANITDTILVYDTFTITIGKPKSIIESPPHNISITLSKEFKTKTIILPPSLDKLIEMEDPITISILEKVSIPQKAYR